MKGFIVKITLFLSLVVLCLSFKTVETFAATDFSGNPGSIQELIDGGIIDASFQPDSNITRAELATFLVKVSGSNGNGSSFGGVFGSPFTATSDWWSNPDPTSGSFTDTPGFTDVPGGIIDWYLDGGSSGVFSPDTVVNREELATVVVSILGFNATGSGEQLPFNDRDTISSWARDYVGYAVANGLMSGDPLNNFNPQNPVTGLEVVQTTLNTIEHAEDLGIIPAPVPVSEPETDFEKEKSSEAKIKEAPVQSVIEKIVKGLNEGEDKIVLTDSGITIDDLLGAIVALDNSKQIYEFWRLGQMLQDITIEIDPKTDTLLVKSENGKNSHTYSFELNTDAPNQPNSPNNQPVGQDQVQEPNQQPQALTEQAPPTEDVVVPE